MNILELLQIVKAIIHTFVRFLPLGFYSFAYLLAALFKDKRGAILLLGLAYGIVGVAVAFVLSSTLQAAYLAIDDFLKRAKIG